MLARSMVAYTELDALKKAKQKTVITAVILGILVATLLTQLISTLIPFAKFGMFPLAIGFCLIVSALIRKQQGTPMWELCIAGQGFALIGIALFIVATVL